MAECSDGESGRLYGQRGNRKLITYVLADLCSDFGFYSEVEDIGRF